MFDASATLLLLQHGDSAYPAGGFAFSWGLEGLAADGIVRDADDLAALVEEQLSGRWNTMDRRILRRAFAADDLDALAALDRLTEAATFSPPMREGSRRAGRALLNVSARLGGTRSGAYRSRLGTDRRLGHLPVAQALAGRDAGLDLAGAEVLSGWTLVAGLCGAAVRLGILGHTRAQGVMSALRPVLVTLLDEAPAANALPSAFTPLADIAVARAATRHLRLFAT